MRKVEGENRDEEGKTEIVEALVVIKPVTLELINE